MHIATFVIALVLLFTYVGFRISRNKEFVSGMAGWGVVLSILEVIRFFL